MSDRSVTPPDLEKYRETLYLAAQLDLNPILKGKLDLSGVIQQTLWDAHKSFEEFRGKSERDLVAWLRRILANNLIDEIRKLERAKYDVRLELSLAESSLRLEAMLTADHTPPHDKVVRNEDLLRLTRALLQLPEDQRKAVVCHHLHGMKLREVADYFGRTKETVAGLIHRGMTKLRQLLAESKA